MPLPLQPPVGPAALSQNARTVLEKRYLVKDKSGKPTETPEDLFWRVATVVAEADRRYGASEGAVTEAAERVLLPDDAASVRAELADAHERRPSARPALARASCFRSKTRSSNGKNGIYDTLRAMALIHQSGGGTGFSFSRLRREGIDGALDNRRRERTRSRS